MATYQEVALTFLALLMHRDPQHFEDNVQTTNGELLDSYDFIIVGAGSAGSTLANRLSEINEWKVLLIEAGGQENQFTKTPAMYAALYATPSAWNYTTTPQERSCQATGGQCAYPRGKALGGTSSINIFIYARGYKSDYDKWGQDNCGWSFQDVEPYFLQSEGNTIPGLLHHGRRGPLTVSYPPYKTSLRDDILQAGLVKGWRHADCPDYEDDCIYVTQMTMRKGRRCSASTAYLKPISNKRPNLHIITNTYVTKVMVENRVATGVEIIRDGTKSKVFASKEVILSAGTINSPQILMLSGIGPRDHLQSLGIPVIADLPVGDNLQDHNRVTLTFKVKNGSVPNIETFADPKIQEQYVEKQKGPYSYTGIELLAFVRHGSECDRREPPNVQHHISTSAFEEDYIAGLTTTTVRPRSRGTVRLKSTDPLDAPLIDTNYYSDLYDLNVTLEGMRDAYDLFQTEPLRSHVVGLSKTSQPLCADEDDLEDFFMCLIKYYTVTNYHPVGTVKMGTRKQNGVVNSNLQVYGIRRLRVIDASIPPYLISMNTNAMAIMIGEKGADLIKATYHKATSQKPKLCPNF